MIKTDSLLSGVEVVIDTGGCDSESNMWDPCDETVLHLDSHSGHMNVNI